MMKKLYLIVFASLMMLPLSLYGQSPVFSRFDTRELGDVNNDGILNVVDVMIIVDYILSPYDNFDETIADANGDGLVDIVDVMRFINMILEDGPGDDDPSDKPSADDDPANPGLPVLLPPKV
jgi:hypothetical protein